MKQKQKTPFLTIRTNKLCHELLEKTSERCGVHVRQLVDLSAAALLSSISKHLPDAPSKAGENDVSGECEKTHSVSISKNLWDKVRDYAYALEVSPIDLMRDAILAQSANLQRLQPVNARNFSSVRVRLFYIEQGDHIRDVPPGGSSFLRNSEPPLPSVG
jgi:hypothetical protein